MPKLNLSKTPAASSQLNGNVTFKLPQNAGQDKKIASSPNTSNVIVISENARPLPVPVRMNDRRIHEIWELSQPVAMKNHSGSLLEWIVKKNYDQLRTLPDGHYDINVHQLIADEKGRVVYYETLPISWSSGYYARFGENVSEALKDAKVEEDAHPLDEETIARITTCIERSLEELVLTPGLKENAAVIARAHLQPKFAQCIAVSNHQVSVERLKQR